MGARGRLPALDGLRGLAALSVVLCHLFNVSPALWNAANAGVPDDRLDTVTRALTFSPLHLVWAGGEAVLLFFLLSGYVLALPEFAGRSTSYAVFVKRRVCRIYLPYLAIVGVAAVLLSLFSRYGDASLSEWFNWQWRRPLSTFDIAALGLMLGGEPSLNVDGPTWSLVHEMRIWLLFPALVLVADRVSWRLSLAGAVWLSIAGAVALPPLPFDAHLTVRYAALFLAGATLARHRHVVGRWFGKRPRRRQAMLLALALGLYVARWQWPLPDAVHDVVIGTGAAMLVVCAEHFMPLTRFLASPFVLWLGRVSYSLYLSHVPILFALIYGLRDLLPVWLILGLALIVALASAEVLQRTVEAPAMWLGRQWATSPRASLPHESRRLTVMPL